MAPKPRTVLIDSLIVFLLSGGFIYKLFAIEYSRNWGSIESTFIADSRMLAEQLPHPGWQPLWYCGTRFDYVYPPALRYSSALISKATGVSTARAYHLYTAILYAFGIVAVYWLVLAGARSRPMACLSAAAAALVSPAFALLPRYRLDSPFWVPQRLHVLTSYGEGPHISSLCVLGAALAASIMAFRSRRLAWVALAGLASALVVSNNFYGATALAILFPLLLWCEWSGSRENRLFLRATAIAALAWGFCAFWLTPSYLKMTAINLRWVAEPGKNSSRLVAAIFLLVLAVWFLVSNSTRRILEHVQYLEKFMRVCAWCRRIHFQGEWMPLEKFMRQGFDTPTTHGICTECLQKQQAAAAQAKPARDRAVGASAKG